MTLVLFGCREFGLQSATITDEVDICVVCLERTCTVAAEGLSKFLSHPLTDLGMRVWLLRVVRFLVS